MCSCIRVSSVYKLKKEKVPVAAIKMTLRHFPYGIKGKNQGMPLPERQFTSFVFELKGTLTIYLYPFIQHFLEISMHVSLNYTVFGVLSHLMSQWNKDFLFSCVNITKREPWKLYAWKLTNKVFCSGEHFVVKSLLNVFFLFFIFFLFTSVWETLIY